MIDKLRSHLKSEKGFTLIELLVVIAIIAVLVVIVIVAINPVKRISDANDRSASSNVRAAGTAIAACITYEEGLTPPPAATVIFGASSGVAPFAIPQTGSGNCGDFAWMKLAANGSISASSLPTGVTVYNDSTSAPTQVCAWALGGSQYYKWTSLTGAVAGTGATTTPTCP